VQAAIRHSQGLGPDWSIGSIPHHNRHGVSRMRCTQQTYGLLADHKLLKDARIWPGHLLIDDVDPVYYSGSTSEMQKL
jgi:hypothetical protein